MWGRYAISYIGIKNSRNELCNKTLKFLVWSNKLHDNLIDIKEPPLYNEMLICYILRIFSSVEHNYLHLSLSLQKNKVAIEQILY